MNNGRHMMATVAHHKLGDVSRDKPDLAWIREEHDDHYVGEWVSGLGLINLRFPKATTRDLTDVERERYAGCVVETAGRVTPTGVTTEKEND